MMAPNCNIPNLRLTQTLQTQKMFEGSSPQDFMGEQNHPKKQQLLVDVPGLIYQFLLRKDGSLNFLFLSPSFQEFFGMESAEMELDTETLVSMIHPGDRDDFYDSIAEAAATLQSWRWAGRFILPSGQTKWVQWDAQPSLQTNGNIFWNGLLVDVTSQYQLNAEVERLSFLFGLTERLQTATDLQEIAHFTLNYLVQSTNCTFGDVKEIRFVNENCQAYPLTNYISAELVTTYGEPVMAEMEATLQQGIPQGEGLLWQVVETGKPLLIEDYGNHPDAVPVFRHPAIRHIGIFPIPATDSTVMGVITLSSADFQKLQDSNQQNLLLAACRILGVRMERVKQQKRLALANAVLESTSQQLRQKAQQLEQTLNELQQAQMQLIQSEKMSSLGSLVAGIAHEINNPVNFIHGNLTHAGKYFQDLLRLVQVYQQCYPHPQTEVQSVIEEIDLDFLQLDLPRLLSSMQVGGKRIRDIVRSLRNFSHLDEAEKKLVDIHEGIDNTLMILNNRLRGQQGHPEIQVIKEYGKLPLVECYGGQLNQVFLNILTNAIDALEAGKTSEDSRLRSSGQSSKVSTLQPIQPTILIRTNIVDSGHIAVQISDNGPGIPKSIQPRLFDPFFTTKPVGQGTGLGLSISYQIVTEQHRGQLKCISTPGQGTKFSIEIPLSVTKAVS